MTRGTTYFSFKDKLSAKDIFSDWAENAARAVYVTAAIVDDKGLSNIEQWPQQARRGDDRAGSGLRQRPCQCCAHIKVGIIPYKFRGVYDNLERSKAQKAGSCGITDSAEDSWRIGVLYY